MDRGDVLGVDEEGSLEQLLRLRSAPDDRLPTEAQTLSAGAVDPDTYVLGPGDVLELSGPQGTVALEVAGVTYDYTSEGGTAFVLMPTLQRHFLTGPPNNAALFLREGQDVGEVVAGLFERADAQARLGQAGDQELHRPVSRCLAAHSGRGV